MKSALALGALLLVALLPAPAAPAAPPEPLAAPASDEPWARALVAALPRATAVNDRDGNKLFDDLDAALLARPTERAAVIVSFVQGVDGESGAARVRQVAPDAPVDRAFRIVPAMSGALSLAEALRVAALPEVRQVELDRPAQKELATSTFFMGADATVDELGVTGSLDGDEGNFTPRDVAIAILDTGFHAEHADLSGGKIMAFHDFGDGKKEPFDEDGHGSHVAGIAAGLGLAKAEYRGVAPGSPIVGLRIVGTNAQGASTALAGYEWIVENKDALGIRVTTMSFGFGVATDGTTALDRAVDAAWDAGLVNFKSNGNSGPERSTMTVPAAARGILGIGAMLDPGGSPNSLPLDLYSVFGFQLAGFSSRGPTTDGRVKPDLVAPGSAIESVESGTKDGYVSLSGTSMASPFAAGAAALVVAANPALTPDQVRDVLVATAEDWGVEGPDVDYGNGRIQVREAVRLALALAQKPEAPSTAPVVPYHEVRAGVVPVPSPANPPFAEGTFEVNDTTHPIAATFIAEGQLLAVQVLDPAGDPIAKGPSEPSRQMSVGFQPTATGTYTYRLVALPGTAYVVDLSHGTAPSLLDALPLGTIEGLPEGTTLGARLDDQQVAAPGVALVVVALVALALARSRRR